MLYTILNVIRVMLLFLQVPLGIQKQDISSPPLGFHLQGFNMAWIQEEIDDNALKLSIGSRVSKWLPTCTHCVSISILPVNQGPVVTVG